MARTCPAALTSCLRQARHEGRIFEIGTIDPVRHLHQPHQVDRAVDLVQIIRGQAELLQQKFGHLRRTVVGDLEPHRVAELALRQFALQRVRRFFTSSSSTNRSLLRVTRNW